MERRADRSGIRGLRATSGDLIEDIHRQQRRRVIKRAAQLAALAIALLLLGVAFKVFADRRARSQSLDAARSHAVQGTLVELDLAAEVLDASLAQDPDHGPTLTARGLLAAVRTIEFQRDPAEARDAVAAMPEGSTARQVAEGLLAFGDGDVEAATAAVPDDGLELGGVAGDPAAYLAGWVAVAHAEDDPDRLAAAIERVQASLEAEPTHVALRRMLARLHVYAGDIDEALVELARARELARSHMGLAADEALYNAHLRQEPGGVASVAEQLLGSDAPGLGPRDLAHARLARAVVHVHSGELEDGMKQLVAAWPDLPAWDRLDRRLAIVTALEAGDAEHVHAWIDEAGLTDDEVGIQRAWAVLLEGDVMKALELLSKLPQEHPRVAYLQALALVEQSRHAEALPWIDRTERLLPGRVEIEVARARAELHTGDKTMALRKLEALAEEEPYAPRAWTGLGQAYLLQEEPELKNAERALQKAVDREPMPADALLGLARVWQLRSQENPDADAEQKALGLLEKAAQANPRLPIYQEELARWLAQLGYERRALPELRAVVKRPGVRWLTVVRLLQLEVAAGNHAEKTVKPLLEQAEELGADPGTLTRERARIALAREDKAQVATAQAELAALLGANALDTEAWVLYSKTFLQQFDRKAAEGAVRKGLQAVPESDKGRLYTAWTEIEARTGKSKVAAPRSRKAWSSMIEEDRPARELLELAELSTRLWLRQRKERVALSVAERLTKRLSHHAEAWTIRASTELQGGEAAQGKKSAQRAVELDPEDPRAHEVLGHAYLRFGQRDEAKAAYEKAVELAKGTKAEAGFRANLKRL
jgi:tetratricopeptide (TPR) repeat protein